GRVAGLDEGRRTAATVLSIGNLQQLRIRPVQRSAKASAKKPLLFMLRERVRVQQIIQALRPRVAILVTRDRVVTGPHDTLDAECVYHAAQTWHKVEIRILLLRQQARCMTPLDRDVWVPRKITDAL